eukprot:TRINITY_DN7575_c0_g1_i4.p1 TRINITY_DN7575_c0_g1~~TRINITY_DN7575_c0_g1_i4.p1  ORF type:complete len:108 (-),score=38.05 TRINITY_DN7575_c0_g1_i4:194-517(-)
MCIRDRITAFAVCEFEQSLMIAKEKGVESWVVDVHTALEVNLDGFMNISPNLHAKDVFLAIRDHAVVTTDADQATIDAIHEETRARCPITQLFATVGTKIEGKWTKA